ncbi:MAG: carboxypeptidase-like regulatory domain-containing protein [Bacteroidales bacterium]|nr:carboxypeptidase-like regulatory domain-containing protein [Bacteroidales bacterium]
MIYSRIVIAAMWLWVLAISSFSANADVHPADSDTLRGIVLREITVGRTKEHYSKHGNPAVDFVNRIRNARELTDPERNQYYNYRKYERISFGINNVNQNNDQTEKHGRFDFLHEHVDTSDVNGLQILPLSVKEKVSDVLYRRSPLARKQFVRGYTRTGIDEFADFDNVQVLVEDIFREIDLYDDDITLLRNRFVSPLSPVGPDFYKYYLTDTAQVAGKRCVVLSFAPRNPATFGFLGRIYVEDADTSMFVRKVDMGVSPTINLNFVNRLRINQTYDKAPDGSRLKTLDDLNIEFRVLDGAPEIYARRTTSYDNHDFHISPLAGLFDKDGDEFVADEAAVRDEAFWIEERQVKTGYNEGRVAELMTRLRSVPAYKYGETALGIFVKGYVSTSAENSKFDIGPLNTIISANSVEGLRVRAGGTTTASLSKHWFGRGYIAYGFKDKKIKYDIEAEYSFNEKKSHSREFPVHSVTVSEKYDIDQLGQNYAFTNPDNMFLSLKRGSNHLITYLRQTGMTYQLELRNNFSLKLDAKAKRMEHGPYVNFKTTSGISFNHYDQLAFTLRLRYSPGEKFMQTKSERLPVNRDAPEFIISHEYVPSGVAGARWGVNRTELSLGKRFWFSAFGYADVTVKGGYVWGQSAFPDLLIPDANLSYTIQRGSFALLNPLEFIGDRYLSWHLTYWANGLLFNQIPYFKRLKLREVIGFRGWIGGLSDKNDPRTTSSDRLLLFPSETAATPMHGRPYMEISAGIDNFFKCLRIDYVWRLTYRNVSCADRSGIRIALHFTF